MDREADRACLAERLVVEVDLAEYRNGAGRLRPVDGPFGKDALAPARIRRRRFVGDEVTERGGVAQAVEQRVDRAVELERRAHRVVVQERAALVVLEIDAA